MTNLESKTRAPIESHFTESVTGAEVVRAYGAQDRFVHKLQNRIDNFNRVTFYQLLSHRWMGIHLLVVGNVICSATSLLRNLARGIKSGALVGLGTAFSLDINSSLGFVVITQSEVEVNLMSMDRVEHYISNPNEAVLRKGQLPLNWPNKGRLEFLNYSLRYRQGRELVLRNISFTVCGGEKVLSAAGKSSLMLSLFRLVEPADGAIVIDYVDIADIGLHDLRENLVIIPQDPFLFTGPLRMKLDPEDLFTDEDILAALDHTHLRGFVESLPGGLDTDCGEGGSNFRILVLGQGEVKEFDSPEKLLQKQGLFYQMTHDAGINSSRTPNSS